MVGDWIIACRRVIMRVTIRRRGHSPQIYRFHADRWHRFRVLVSAFQIETQTLDSIPMAYHNQPALLVMRANAEGATYYKASATAEYAPRKLRPLEVTDDVVWRGNEKPVVVINNPTNRAIEVDIVYATRETGDPIGGGGGGGNLF